MGETSAVHVVKAVAFSLLSRTWSKITTMLHLVVSLNRSRVNMFTSLKLYSVILTLKQTHRRAALIFVLVNELANSCPTT